MKSKCVCKDCKCITIGADVEFFLADGDKIVSAIGRIPGTKKKQHILNSGAGLHHDNVSLEIAFKYFNNFEDFNSHVVETIKEVEGLIRPLKLITIPSHIMDLDELSDPLAWQFGCDPDFNAWTEDLNRPPEITIPRLRTCGGHVHVAIKELAANQRDYPFFVRHMDSTLGVWSLQHDHDDQRRLLYGKAGAFRPKEYGVEYRVLSNFWIANENLRRSVWDLTISLANEYKSGKLTNEPDQSTRDLINNYK